MTLLCLTVGYVPGVTPTKWARTWAQRHPEVPLQLHAVAAADAADALRAGRDRPPQASPSRDVAPSGPAEPQPGPVVPTISFAAHAIVGVADGRPAEAVAIEPAFRDAAGRLLAADAVAWTRVPAAMRARLDATLLDETGIGPARRPYGDVSGHGLPATRGQGR